ncbi:MAG: HAD hydrolase-like protein [Nanoarchaeota archaeon]|nr:HAD hydrolase-like protein [Nanoarchaeota archaeon]
MSITHIILDFDGTLTNVFEELKDYDNDYTVTLAELLDADVEILWEIYQETKMEVINDPSKGWSYNGQIVCHANADPYMPVNTVFPEVLQILRDGEYDSLGDRLSAFYKELNFDAKVFEGKTNEDILEKAYQKSKKKTGIIYREGLETFLQKLTAKYSVAIVTSSGESDVKDIVEKLGYKGIIEVVGDAYKHDNNPDFTEVEAEHRIEGLPRPVLLRREKYFDKLKELETEKGFRPENTAVIGDIYELDLALPEHLGYTAIQLRTEGTPEYEAQYHAAAKNTHLFDNYSQILDFFEL